MSSSNKPTSSQAEVPFANTKSAHTLPEVIDVKILEDGNIQVMPIDELTISTRIKTANTLFLELRRKIRELTNDQSWTVRYASRVDNPLLPFLHSSDRLKVLIDVMSPYRNPLDALSRDGVLILVYLPSHVYYFKPKGEVIQNVSVLTHSK